MFQETVLQISNLLIDSQDEFKMGLHKVRANSALPSYPTEHNGCINDMKLSQLVLSTESSRFNNHLTRSSKASDPQRVLQQNISFQLFDTLLSEIVQYRSFRNALQCVAQNTTPFRYNLVFLTVAEEPITSILFCRSSTDYVNKPTLARSGPRVRFSGRKTVTWLFLTPVATSQKRVCSRPSKAPTWDTFSASSDGWIFPGGT